MKNTCKYWIYCIWEDKLGSFFELGRALLEPIKPLHANGSCYSYLSHSLTWPIRVKRSDKHCYEYIDAYSNCMQYPQTPFCSSYVTYLWPSQHTILPCHPKAPARRCILVPRFLVSGHKCNVHNTQLIALIIWPCLSGNLLNICSKWFTQLFYQPMSRTCLATAANNFVWCHHIQSEITYVTLLMIADNVLLRKITALN